LFALGYSEEDIVILAAHVASGLTFDQVFAHAVRDAGADDGAGGPGVFGADAVADAEEANADAEAEAKLQAMIEAGRAMGLSRSELKALRRDAEAIVESERAERWRRRARADAEAEAESARRADTNANGGSGSNRVGPGADGRPVRLASLAVLDDVTGAVISVERHERPAERARAEKAAKRAAAAAAAAADAEIMEAIVVPVASASRPTDAELQAAAVATEAAARVQARARAAAAARTTARSAAGLGFGHVHPHRSFSFTAATGAGTLKTAGGGGSYRRFSTSLSRTLLSVASASAAAPDVVAVAGRGMAGRQMKNKLWQQEFLEKLGATSAGAGAAAAATSSAFAVEAGDVASLRKAAKRAPAPKTLRQSKAASPAGSNSVARAATATDAEDGGDYMDSLMRELDASLAEQDGALRGAARAARAATEAAEAAEATAAARVRSIADMNDADEEAIDSDYDSEWEAGSDADPAEALSPAELLARAQAEALRKHEVYSELSGEDGLGLTLVRSDSAVEGMVGYVKPGYRSRARQTAAEDGNGVYKTRLRDTYRLFEEQARERMDSTEVDAVMTHLAENPTPSFPERVALMRGQDNKVPKMTAKGIGGDAIENFDLDEGDLVERFIRGSGPGGQAVNKTRNCVFLQHMPTGTIVKCHQTRSLFENRMIARKILKRKLEELKLGRDSYLQRKAARIRRRKDRNRRRYFKKSLVGDGAEEGTGSGEDADESGAA
jgi:hypothetical protein